VIDPLPTDPAPKLVTVPEEDTPETTPLVLPPETSLPSKASEMQPEDAKTDKTKAAGEKVVIELRNADGEAGLKRLNQFTQIFSYDNDQAWLQFSFDRVPFGDDNVLDACRKSFRYCNVEVRFPDRATETSRVYTQLRGPLRALGTAKSFQNMKDVKLTFSGFEQGRLNGTLTGTITRLTTRTEGPGLVTGDIAGVGHVDNDANIPFVVNFDLSVD